MNAFTNILFKTTLSSMILTAPAMTGNKNDVTPGASKETMLPYYTEAVIKKFVNYNHFTASPLYSEKEGKTLAVSTISKADLNPMPAASVVLSASVASASTSKSVVSTSVVSTSISSASTSKSVASVSFVSTKVSVRTAAAAVSTSLVLAESKSVELKMVINQAAILYDYMNLEKTGLDQKAFEYAWRGYHNLLKKGLIRKKAVLSICDFSQSSCSKRMYVIDVRHKRLLYRTYVAHGQNSGAEFASSFSNEPESFKSSLGFYVTRRTYWGKNGLSLKIEGVDTGYNDLAGKRNIVLHGSTYVSQKYMSNFGSIGTSLGCPAIPLPMSPRIIRAVKNGSCFFIYHPTQTYFEQSTVLNNG